MAEGQDSAEKVFRGIAVSPGVCHARLLVLQTDRDVIHQRALREDEVDTEVERLEKALLETRMEIQQVQRQVSESIGSKDAGIFDAHLMVLEDPALIDEVLLAIRKRHINAEAAFQEVAQHYAETLATIEDDFLRERAADMRDVTGRVMNRLLGKAPSGGGLNLEAPTIIIAHDLTPSLTAQFRKDLVVGFATDVGSRTSHTAILARSLEIPAVVGLGRISTELSSGQTVLLDGYNGVVILNPTDQTLFEYGQLVNRRASVAEELSLLRDLVSETLDGERIQVSANLERAEDSEAVTRFGADGVGLFRTEYLFIQRQVLPSEEEQYQAYVQVARAVAPKPVIIRTLDLGGDKFLSHLNLPLEMNPFLGWRAIRFCLQQPDIFRVQLRAILRASEVGNVKVMYPMVSGLDEVLEANAMLEECKQQLRSEGVAFDPSIPVGAMIEIPSAALTAQALAKRVQFLSIGTNDLIQYALAVDRLNEKIAHLYEPTHPAILHLIRMTVDAGKARRIPVSLCGEIAGDPLILPLLLGLGVKELSVAAPMIPQVKMLVRGLTMADARTLGDFALHSESPGEILRRSEFLARQAAPQLFSETQLPYRK